MERGVGNLGNGTRCPASDTCDGEKNTVLGIVCVCERQIVTPGLKTQTSSLNNGGGASSDNQENAWHRSVAVGQGLPQSADHR